MNHEDKHAKHEGKDKEFVDKHHDKMRGTATANSGSIKKIPVEMTDIHKDKDRSNGTTASNKTPLPGTAGKDTIHPIPDKAAPVASAPSTGTGMTNTIHPITSPPPGTVTISNGVTTYQIPNGAGGVSAFSGNPDEGWITITNGTESRSLKGGSVTVSGAIGIGGDANDIEVGSPNGEGKTVVAIRPHPAPAAPPAPPVPGHVTGGPEGGFFGALGNSILDAGKAVGRGAVDVISVGGPTPGTPGAGEPKTSTSTQQ